MIRSKARGLENHLVKVRTFEGEKKFQILSSACLDNGKRFFPQIGRARKNFPPRLIKSPFLTKVSGFETEIFCRNRNKPHLIETGGVGHFSPRNGLLTAPQSASSQWCVEMEPEKRRLNGANFWIAMKTDAGQVMELGTEAVFTDAAPIQKKTESSSGLPGIQLLIAISAAALVVVIAASVWIYLSQAQAVKAAAGQGSAQLVSAAERWALLMGAVTLGGGVLLVAVTILGGQFLHRRWTKLHLALKEETDSRSHRLLSQLADSRVTEEEARNAKDHMEGRLAGVVKARAELEAELNQKREVEKTLAQQTQQLERSKDVLEFRVQARTQELQKLQKRTELLLTSAGDGICGFDLQGKATFVNPSAAKLTGWKIDELVGRTEEAIFFMRKTKGANDVAGLLTDADGNYLPEQTFYRQDGSSFPVEYVKTPIKENGKVMGAVVMFKDITERRLTEDKLNRKANELARSNRELEQFAFVASHDLQEPLRKIQAFGDRLKVKCEAVQLDEGRDYLERMQSAAARMQTLINDLLTFSRVISSSQPFAPVDLGAVTKEVLGDLEHRIERTGAKVEVGTLPTVEADATQMRQLLQNLIGNALKFQAPGASPNIKIDGQLVNRGQLKEKASLPNTPEATPDDKFCVLTVQDNGIGFDEQYLEKIFAVFQRLHGRSEYEGTGVGLAVCRRITDRHGGLITAQSKPGQGAVFIVILPVEHPKVEVTT